MNGVLEGRVWYTWSYTGSPDLLALYQQSEICCLKSFTQTGCSSWVSAEESLPLLHWKIIKFQGGTRVELWGFSLHSFASKTHKQMWLGGDRSVSKGKQGAFQWCRLQVNGLLWFSESSFSDIFRFVVPMYCDVLECSHQVFFNEALNFPLSAARGNLQVGLMQKIKTALRLSLKCSATN